MNAFIFSMEPQHMVGYLITAIVCLGGVVAWLHRDTVSRMDRDKKDLKLEFDAHKADTKDTIKTLDDRLYASVREEYKAKMEAVEAKLQAQQARQPCVLTECPRRTSFSISESAHSAVL